MSVSMGIANTMELSGTPIVAGLAFAPAFHFKHLDLGTLKDHGFPVENISDEIERLDRAIAESVAQVVRLQTETRARTGDQIAEIFQAHGSLLNDESLLSKIRSLVSERGVNAEYVLANEIARIESQFSGLAEEHLQVRLLDIQDVLHRLLRNLLNIEHVRSTPLRRITEQVILVAENLLPSDLTLIDLSHVAGIVLEGGSASSHVAIMSRSMRVPAVFRVRGLTPLVRNGMPILLDGYEGRVVLHPSEKMLGWYQKKVVEMPPVVAQPLRTAQCRTKDGVKVSLLANAASIEDVEQGIAAGAEGIGLLRSEFYYLALGRQPTLEEEIGFYREVITRCNGKQLTIRLLDLGADKNLPYLKLPREQNPQLGLRGIRLLLVHEDLLRSHCTAIIRASGGTPIRLLIPFVSCVEEVEAVRKIVADVAHDEGTDVSSISIGMMVEIPVALFSLESFLPSVDFLSFGSNDLIQYTCAIDRDHAELEQYRRNTESMACRMTEFVCTLASRENKPVTVCGEIAGNPYYASILVGLGIRSLSMQADSIGAVAEGIARKTLEETVADARHVIRTSLNGSLYSSE